MPYYRLGTVSGFTLKNLSDFLSGNRSADVYYNGFSCREVLNRHTRSHETNLMIVHSGGDGKGNFIDSLEIKGNRDNLQRLLQSIIDLNNPDKTKVIVGNRFLCFENPVRLRSPLGSLIAGIHKIVVRDSVEEEEYEKYKDALIDKILTAGSYLNGTITNLSVAICTKYYSEYPMPDDPEGLGSAYGTMYYLQLTKDRKVKMPANNEIYDYFVIKGIVPQDVLQLITRS